MFPSSPGANSFQPLAFGSTNVPLQCCCARLPAAFTQRIPAARAAATIPSGVSGVPEPSPRLVLNQLAEWLMIWMPVGARVVDGEAEPGDVLDAHEVELRVGRHLRDDLGDAVPWLVASKPPGPQKSTLTAERGRSPVPWLWRYPLNPRSTTAIFTPCPRAPDRCQRSAPLAATPCPRTDSGTGRTGSRTKRTSRLLRERRQRRRRDERLDHSAVGRFDPPAAACDGRSARPG